MPFYDIHLSATGRRIMTLEATDAIQAAHRAPIAALHTADLATLDEPLTALIAVRPHVPPFTDATFADGFFKVQAQLGHDLN